MLATKRIPVTETVWKELGKLKEAGQTYDELLEELIVERNRYHLAERSRSAKESKGKWILLEDN